MTHLKRQQVPKSWGMEKKGTKFVVKPLRGFNSGIPILIAIRDMLKLAQNRKEVKKAIYSEKIKLNNKKIKDDRNCVSLFDVIKIVPSNENYRLELDDKGKFKLEKINEKQADKKVSKVIGKKVLKGKINQLNLIDGNNFNSEIKCKRNDSVLVDLKTRKIEKCLALDKGANAIIFSGKHSGKKGKIINIDKEKKMVEIKTSEKEDIHVLIKQVMVME
ncbi:hypothetical protein K9L16_02960 [Candidatus Pacearchaeota archaeon]|nr:hypothetical protein [Candidatus Pacearchaeota archaeon]